MAIVIRLLLFGLIGWLVYRWLTPLFSRANTANKRTTEDQYQDVEKKDPYQILEVTPNCKQDTIKQAYYRKLAEYHPDKVAHLGSDLQILAQKKTQAITWAYEVLTKNNSKA